MCTPYWRRQDSSSVPINSSHSPPATSWYDSPPVACHLFVFPVGVASACTRRAVPLSGLPVRGCTDGRSSVQPRDVYFFMIKAVLSVLSGLTNPFGHTDRTGLGASSTQFTQFGQTDWSE